MRIFLFVLLISIFSSTNTFGQTDSLQAKKTYTRNATHRDSLQLAKLNSSGNLMIAGGVGLCGVSAYLLYYGIKTYKTLPSDPMSSTYQAQLDRNKRQGTIYIAAGGIAAAAGIVLTALGARNKIDFKARKRMMEMEGGILRNGDVGLAFNF